MMHTRSRGVLPYGLAVGSIVLALGVACGAAPDAAPAPPSPAAQPPNPAVPPSPQTPPAPPKLAPPNQAARAPFLKLAHEAYQKQYADRSPEGRRTFAKKLLEEADKEKQNPVAHYVLLDEAFANAIASADIDTCRKAVDALDQSFILDASDMIAQVLTKAPSAGEEDSLYAWALEYADRLISRDNAAGARRVTKLVAPRVNRAKDPANKVSLKNVETMLVEYDRDVVALEKLAADPNDPASNLAAGRYYCFIRHDFDKGLPFLARGSDSPLKALAQRDLANPADANVRYELAGSWWALGDQKVYAASAPGLHLRARYWYAGAVAELAGLKKTLAERRLAQAPAASMMKLGQDLTYLATFDTATIGRVGPDSVLKDAIGKQGAGVIHGCTVVDGKFGQALHFNGSSDYIDLTSTPLAPAGAAPRTITVWTRTESRGFGAILALGNAVKGQAFNLCIGYSGAPGIVGVMGYFLDYYPTRGTSIADGNWHFVAVVLDKRATIFIDGAVDNTAPEAFTYQTAGQHNYIGRSNHPGFLRHYHGDLDDLAVWQRALSAEEISQIYKSGVRGVSLSDLVRNAGSGK